jgi:hypothetical protein
MAAYPAIVEGTPGRETAPPGSMSAMMSAVRFGDHAILRLADLGGPPFTWTCRRGSASALGVEPQQPGRIVARHRLDVLARDALGLKMQPLEMRMGHETVEEHQLETAP